LLKRVEYLEDELITFTKNKPAIIIQPHIIRRHLSEVANASTPTKEKIAAENMDIEINKR